MGGSLADTVLKIRMTRDKLFCITLANDFELVNTFHLNHEECSTLLKK